MDAPLDAPDGCDLRRDLRAPIIIGVSIALHAVIAVWALLGDPPVDRPLLGASTHRVFVPDRDDVIADVTFDASVLPPLPMPARPAVARPVVAPPAVRATTHPAHAALAPSRSPKAIVDGLFSDDHGPGDPGGVARRRPATDLQAQIDAARRHDGTATIGGDDPRVRGDDGARIGTAPQCVECLPKLGEPTRTATPTDLQPPVVHVEPPPGPLPSDLDPDQVLRIITTTYMAGLERCQRDLARRTGDARGRVALELTIGGDGATTSSAASGVDDGLDRCVEARAGGWRFPVPHDAKTGAPTSAHYRLSLALQAQ